MPTFGQVEEVAYSWKPFNHAPEAREMNVRYVVMISITAKDLPRTVEIVTDEKDVRPRLHSSAYECFCVQAIMLVCHHEL